MAIICVFIHAISYMFDKHTDIVFNAGDQMMDIKKQSY